MRIRAAAAALLPLAAVAISACGGHGKDVASSSTATTSTRSAGSVLPQKPSWAPPNPHNVYAADAPGDLSPIVRHDRPLIYVPNSEGNTVDEIDPHTYRIVREFAVGALPQHVIPSYDLRTLYVANDDGNTLTPIDPATGIPGRPIPVEDPYNMYFTPDGRYAVVVEERLRELAFRHATTMKLHHLVNVSECAGVNHADFTFDGRFMLLSCEFGSSMIVLDVNRERVVKTARAPTGCIRAATTDSCMSPIAPRGQYRCSASRRTRWSRRGRSRAEARTWATCRRMATCSGCRAGMTTRCTRSTRGLGGCWRGFPSVPVPTGCAYGRNPGATRSDTPASCAEGP